MINYIIAFRGRSSQAPISVFVKGEYYLNLDYVANIFEAEADALIVSETLLDYDSYYEDRTNITLNLLKVLDETDC